MGDASTLFATIFWSLVGAGFCIYGWRRKAMICLCGGLVLSVIPFLMASALNMSFVGAGILAAVFWFDKRIG